MKRIIIIFFALLVTATAYSAEQYKVVYQITPYSSYIKVLFKVYNTTERKYMTIWPKPRGEQEQFCNDEGNFNALATESDLTGLKSSSVYTITKFISHPGAQYDLVMEKAIAYADRVSRWIARDYQTRGYTAAIDPAKIVFTAKDNPAYVYQAMSPTTDQCGCLDSYRSCITSSCW